MPFLITFKINSKGDIVINKIQSPNQPKIKPFPQVLIHPTALLNIATSFSREINNCNSELWILLGDRSHDKIRIRMSSESLYTNNPEGKEIDFFQTNLKISTLLKVFPYYRVLGFYLAAWNQNEKSLLDKFEVEIDDPLFLIWDINHLSNQPNSSLYQIDIDSTSSNSTALIQVHYSTEGLTVNIFDNLATLKQDSKENIYTLLIDEISRKIDELALSSELCLMKAKALRILKILDVLKASIMGIDVTEHEFFSINLKLINSYMKKINKATFEKETCLNYTPNFNKNASIENLLEIIKCISYNHSKEKQLSLHHLLKWFESTWAPYFNVILELVCKYKHKIEDSEIDYMISKLKECDVVKTTYYKWDALPIQKFEEFCLLWVLALRNKPRYQETITMYLHIAIAASSKIAQFNNPRDNEIGSFILYWITLINDEHDKTTIHCGEYINKIIIKVKTRCTLDLIMELIAITNCEFQEKPFIEILADLFRFSNEELILKVLTIKETFFDLFTTHYMLYSDSYSDKVYRSRVAYILNLINNYICNHKILFQLSVLENLDQKIKIENFWDVENYKEILQKLVETQMETGIYNKNFLNCYFDWLTSESHDPSDCKEWIENLTKLLKYMFLCRNQIRPGLIYDYIVRFISNILKYMKKLKSRKLIAILDLAYRFIPGLWEEINKILLRIYDEEISARSNCLNGVNKWVEQLPEGINHFSEVIKHNLNWKRNEEIINVPSFVSEAIGFVVEFLKNFSGIQVKQELKQKFEKFTIDGLRNFDMAEISSEACKTSNTIAKYLVSILLKWGIDNMIRKFDYYIEKNDENGLGLYWVSQVDVFEKLSESFILKSIFDEHLHFAIRQLLVWEIWDLFNCTLNTNELYKILAKLNNYAAMVMIESPPEEISKKNIKDLCRILHSNVAESACIYHWALI